MSVKTAIDIEKLLYWAYVTEAVASAASAGLAGQADRDDDSVHATTCFGAISNPPADAMLVAWAVGRLGAIERAIVLKHAMTCSRPDWKPGKYPHLVPILKKYGKRAGLPEMEYDQNDRPILCKLREVDAREIIDSSRAEYGRWHAAVAAVASTLRLHDARLERWTVIGPHAHGAPWTVPDLVARARLLATG